MSVAVVIPLFNHERFIVTSIESVLGQTRPVDKIVVVDDGSTDGSVEAVRKIGDPRIALFTQQNAGAHSALNRAILEARDCEFIAILNSDDVYHPQRIEKCVAFLEANSPVDVVCTNRFTCVPNVQANGDANNTAVYDNIIQVVDLGPDAGKAKLISKVFGTVAARGPGLSQYLRT